MPTRRKRDQELPNVLKILEPFKWAAFYHLCASLHSSPTASKGEHDEELVKLITSARGYMDGQVQLLWPGLADADMILKSDEITQKLAPIATMIPAVIEKLLPIVSREWLPLDDLVENYDGIVDNSKLVTKLTQRLQELSNISVAKLAKIEQQLSDIERRQRHAAPLKMSDLEPEILWLMELALLLKLGFRYIIELYLGYAFFAYVLFTYTLSEVVRAMQQSRQSLRDFLSRENNLSNNYWCTQLRPALVVLSGNPSLVNVLTPENEAMVEVLEARYRLGGDRGKALNILWDLGVRAGGKPIRWSEVMADLHGVQVNEKLQDSLYRLLTTLDGYVKEKDFYTVLEEGAEGKLLNSLKKATWHDFLDEKKRAGAKKRKAEVIPFSQLSEYQGNGAEDLPLDEVVSRVAERQPDAALDSVEAKLTLEQLSGVPGLTDRERQALLLEIALVEENGELPTYEGLGKAMGVTKGAAKKLLDRAFKKLRRYVLQD